MLTESEITALVDDIVKRALGDGLVPETALVGASLPQEVPATSRTIAIGSDHGGFKLKSVLIPHLEAGGHIIVDCGTGSSEAVDYPDFAVAVAKRVSAGEAWRGIMIDGAGIGSCMAANKVPGVRAAMCYDLSTASNSREHNNANMLTLGAGLIGETLALHIVERWLSTAFAGGRHQTRVDKISALDSRLDLVGSKHDKQS